MSDCVIALVTDRAYYERAIITIKDIRVCGEWTGPIILICIDFTPELNFTCYYRVQAIVLPHINVTPLKAAWEKCPIKRANDDRHTLKLAQWNKLYIFTRLFAQWKKVLYFDAGMRIFSSLAPLAELDCKGCIIAPDDSCPGDNGNRLRCQFDMDSNPDATTAMHNEYGKHYFSQKYFMNCMWIFDTSLLEVVNCQKLLATMEKYPISMTNEMAIMNLHLLPFWKPLPLKIGEKIPYAWSNIDYGNAPWWNFIMIKYPTNRILLNDVIVPIYPVQANLLTTGEWVTRIEESVKKDDV